MCEWMKALREYALQFPEAEEGVACAGTAIECCTFKARKKTFLFVGAAELRLKLGDSVDEATRLATTDPGRYQVGAQGWVKIRTDALIDPPLDLLQRWIDESYRLLVPRQLVAQLTQRPSRSTCT